VADYLVKPVRRERLLEALQRLPLTTRPQRAARSRPSIRIAADT
jgi:response regulator of citrate/malate metabolism